MCTVLSLQAAGILPYFSVSIHSLNFFSFSGVEFLFFGLRFFLLIGCLGLLEDVGGFKDNLFFLLVILPEFSSPAFCFLVEISSGLTVFDVFLGHLYWTTMPVLL